MSDGEDDGMMFNFSTGGGSGSSNAAKKGNSKARHQKGKKNNNHNHHNNNNKNKTNFSSFNATARKEGNPFAMDTNSTSSTNTTDTSNSKSSWRKYPNAPTVNHTRGKEILSSSVLQNTTTSEDDQLRAKLNSNLLSNGNSSNTNSLSTTTTTTTTTTIKSKPKSSGTGGGIRSNFLISEFTSNKKQIVSSLFTSNPTVSVPTSKPTQSNSKSNDNDSENDEDGDDIDEMKGNQELLVAETFSDLFLDPKLLTTIESQMRLTRLTPVQKIAIPVLMRGGDALIRSETGTGKTLTFLIPIVNKLVARTTTIKRTDGVQAVILAPTRELALQIFSVLQQLVRNHIHIVPGLVTGGEKRKSEKARLRKGVNILIGTPGRLLDHLLHTRCFSIASVKWLVLDEADRLTDLGFEKEVSSIVRALNGDRYGLIREDRERRYGANNVNGYNQSKNGNNNKSNNKNGKKSEQEEEFIDDNADDDDDDNNNNNNGDDDNEGKEGKSNTDDKDLALELTPNYQKNNKTISRQTILISATLQEGVKRLAGITLKDPTFVDATQLALKNSSKNNNNLKTTNNNESQAGLSALTSDTNGELNFSNLSDEKFTLPAHLKQTYVVVPLKLRLVTLAAFLLHHCGTEQHKALVFLSSRDSVDFHYKLFYTSKFGSSSQATILSLKAESGTNALEKELLSLTNWNEDDSEPEDVSDNEESDDEEEDDDGRDKKSKSSAKKSTSVVSRKGTLFETIPLFKLHGSMNQNERTEVYRDFTKSKSGVLLCTDVAARGLDVPNVDWIVQFNTPGETADYIHRVGRTARLGKAGNALIFLSPNETGYIQTLESAGVTNIHQAPLDSILQVLPEIVESKMPSFTSFISASTRKSEGEEGGSNSTNAPSANNKKKGKKSGLLFSEEEAATAIQICFEKNVNGGSSNKNQNNGKKLKTSGGENEENGSTMIELAKQAYQSYIRAYATYPSSLKGIFHVKSLHLGHLAKSFALRDAPTDLSHNNNSTNSNSKDDNHRESTSSSSSSSSHGSGHSHNHSDDKDKNGEKKYDRRLSFRHDEEKEKKYQNSIRSKRRAVDEFGNGNEQAYQHNAKKPRLFPKSMMKKKK